MAKKISFEPAHFTHSARNLFSDERVVIDGRRYAIESLDARAAARYKYHHSVSRLVGMSLPPYCTEEIILAEDILEHFFNSGKEYLLDEQGNTHQMGTFRKLVSFGEVQRYVVLPREDQIKDILGLGYRSIQRRRGPSILGRSLHKVKDVCELYKDCTDWTFRTITQNQIERNDDNESVAEVTLKLSSKGFRFSVE